MSFFSNLEKSIEGVIEKTLLGKFGGKVQPIEIARGLWREISSHQRIGVNCVYVPNRFVIGLSVSDSESLRSIQGTVAEEITDYIERESHMRDFNFVGPITVEWQEDKSLKEGSFTISSDFYESRDEKEIVKEKTREIDLSRKSDTIIETKDGRNKISELLKIKGFFTVIEGFDEGKIFKLSFSPYTAGRSDECDISIGDPKVSRRHFKLIPEGDRFCIEDLNSRGGVWVNGNRIVEKRMLCDGDEVKVGMTLLKYKET